MRFITERIETLKEALFTKTRAVQDLKTTLAPGKTDLNVPEEILGEEEDGSPTEVEEEDEEDSEGTEDEDEGDLDEGGFEKASIKA